MGLAQPHGIVIFATQPHLKKSLFHKQSFILGKCNSSQLQRNQLVLCLNRKYTFVDQTSKMATPVIVSFWLRLSLDNRKNLLGWRNDFHFFWWRLSSDKPMLVLFFRFRRVVVHPGSSIVTNRKLYFIHFLGITWWLLTSRDAIKKTHFQIYQWNHLLLFVCSCQTRLE